MGLCRHYLPSFRSTCIGVGALYVLLGGSILIRGTDAAMKPFAVPETTLTSPHFNDAIIWVYTHQVVIGVLTLVIGFTAEGNERLKRWFARAMLLAHAVYLWMDTRSSDSWLGTGLYKGPASLAPAVICLVVTALFAHLSFCEHSRTQR